MNLATDGKNSGVWRYSVRMAIWILLLCSTSALYAASTSSQTEVQQPAQLHQQYPELPAGAGRGTLIRVCSKCHSPQRVVAYGQNQEGWENTITKMVGYGATGSDADFTAILDYLVKNFPPSSVTTINVNKATAAQLESGLGISTTGAKAIIDYRKKNGDIKSFEELTKIPGLNSEKLAAEKSRITF